jgi:hypothetical protein
MEWSDTRSLTAFSSLVLSLREDNHHRVTTLVRALLRVNTKKWYRKEVDLWAELGDEINIRLGRIFSKDSVRDACGREYAVVRQKDCLRFKREVFGNA